MNMLKLAWRETIGMFIDDGALATWSLVLVVVIGVLAETQIINGTVGAVLLCLGIFAILAESVLRAARKSHRRR